MNAFAYPATTHERRHGPQGYASHASFRPWLRDEFSFRCVFCLRREQWDRCISIEVDHYRSAAANPNLRLDYDNLLYVCARCNASKGAQSVPDPLATLLSGAVSIDAEGRLHAANLEARQLVRALRLDSVEFVHFRRMWLELIALAEQFDPRLYRQLLGYPDELPDLTVLRPPGGNSRPDGIRESALSRRIRGELPGMY